MNKSNLIFISAHKVGVSKEENKKATIELGLLLNDFKYDFKLVQGVYKGQIEPSYMVEIENNIDGKQIADIKFLSNVSGLYNQDSILLVARDNSSFLIEAVTQKEVYIGMLKNVSKDYIDNNYIENYTKIDNSYFTTIKGE